MFSSHDKERSSLTLVFYLFIFIQRHVYTELVKMNISPLKAELLVFLMSAALCEVSLLLHNNEKPSSPNNNVLLLFYSSTQYLIALPLHSCRLWIFLTMVLEVRFFQQVIIYVFLFTAAVLLSARGL